MTNFRRRNRDELARLNDEELVAYIREALAGGDRGAAGDGFAVLVQRYEGDVARRVRAKVPPSDIDDVAQEAWDSAMRAAFKDTEIRNFKALLNKIVSRRIADYTRKRASEIKAQPLAEEHLEAEDIWGDVPAEEDETDAVALRDLIAEVYGQLNEVHQAVVDKYVFGGYSAQETADEINKMFEGHPDLTTPMTNDNVHQIAKRFRDDLRGLLEDQD
ncbi:MAG: RNA polymerase sigma factor [Solirubrobacterales bacterium]